LDTGPEVLAWPMPDNPGRAAHELFATLRRFDAESVSSIWVEQPPGDPEWDGVRDRLQRASTR
jgi:L-threonylcarbamoyladenylate synthase